MFEHAAGCYKTLLFRVLTKLILTVSASLTGRTGTWSCLLHHFSDVTPISENKETQALHDTIDRIDLIDIYRTFHPKVAEYTFFSSAHRTFSRIDHISGHKSSLGKCKKIEIISSIFSDHNAMRLKINYRKKTVKNTNTWRLNSALLNNQEITEEIKEEIKK